MTKPDGTVVEFSYDAFSRRMQKRVSRPSRAGGRPVPVSLTRFVWDGDEARVPWALVVEAVEEAAGVVEASPIREETEPEPDAGV